MHILSEASSPDTNEPTMTSHTHTHTHTYTHIDYRMQFVWEFTKATMPAVPLSPPHKAPPIKQIHSTVTYFPYIDMGMNLEVA